MLLVANTSANQNRRSLTQFFRQELVPRRVELRRGSVLARMDRWRDYWRAAAPFFQEDARLVQRLNRLKRTWQVLISEPRDLETQRRYAWRYFGLLHYSLMIARSERRRVGALDALERIVAFESFVCEASEEQGMCGGILSSRHPAWVLSELGQSTPLPSPRRVPLIRPYCGDGEGYYHYRQIALDEKDCARLLLFPAANLTLRGASFGPIERILRLCGSTTDPYARERARLLSSRAIGAILKQIVAAGGTPSILDLGAGTGHLVARLLRESQVSGASIHFLDVHPPSGGRGFGIRGCPTDVESIEWTVGDYRALLDRDDWLSRAGPFDVAFVCRLLDNLSTFELASVSAEHAGSLPHQCLAQRQPDGLSRLRVAGRRTSHSGGVSFPQHSLGDYFAAMRIVRERDIDAAADDGMVLPVRRFNPASLITRDGRSVIAQLAKAAKVIFIDDMDLTPADLRQHCERFGLSNLSVARLAGDRHRTESNSFVISQTGTASSLEIPGERLW